MSFKICLSDAYNSNFLTDIQGVNFAPLTFVFFNKLLKIGTLKVGQPWGGLTGEKLVNLVTITQGIIRRFLIIGPKIRSMVLGQNLQILLQTEIPKLRFLILKF